MRIQRALDSDIAMVFDECTPYPADERRGGGVDGAARLRWAERSRASATRAPTPNALFGIVQGGMYEDLRDESLAGLAGHRLRRLRDRRAVGRRAEGGDAARARAHRAAPAGRPAALPDGRRHAGGHRRRRWRAASTCSTACCRPATRATAGSSPAGATSGSATPATGPTRGRSTRPAAATPAGTSRAPTCTTCSARTRSSARGSRPIHNLHYYLSLIARMREAIAAGDSTLAAGSPRPRSP